MDLTKFVSLMSKLKIKHRDTGAMTPFVLFPNQITAVNVLAKQYEEKGKIRAIFLKSRRVTVSSLCDSLLFGDCLSLPHRENLIVAHVKDTSEGLFRVPRDLANEINTKANVCRVMTKRIVVQHGEGSSLLDIATAGTVASGRGLTLSGCHLSEAAQYPGQDSFLSLLPAVSKGLNSNIFVESTAFGKTGVGQTFYEFWQSAVARKNDYVDIFLGWLTDPACVADEQLANDAPATDLERELMAKPFFATRAQIAWMRMVLESECQAYEKVFLQEYPHCLVADTRVSTLRGIVPITAVRKGDSTGDGEVVAVTSNGVHDVLDVHFRSGRKITATLNHPFEHPSGVFYTADRLRPRDRILLSPPLFADHNYFVHWQEFGGVECALEITEDWGAFLGYFMGDGSYHGAQVSVCCDRQDEDVVNDVSRLFDLILGGHQNRHPSQGATEVRVSRPAFLPLMKRLGIQSDFPSGKGAYRRVCVPECIWKSPRPVVRKFLSTLFEADGWNGYNHGSIVKFYTKHDQFARDIQLLLLGFGVTSRICKQTRHRKEKTYEGSSLWLRTAEAERFNNVIGFVGERKRSKFLGTRPHGRNKKLGFVRGIELVDEVSSVVPAGRQEVFDLTIEPHHVFSANGLSSHNTPSVAFIATGDPAFTAEEINFAESTCKTPIATGHMNWRDGKPHFVRVKGGSLNLWEEPKWGHKYFIGMDAAVGVEAGDFAAISVWDGTTGRQVAQYADRSVPEVVAIMLNYLGLWYNRALINGELTGNSGREVLRVLRDSYHYSNLALWKGKDDKITGGRGKSPTLWWEMTSYSRRKLFDCFRLAVRGAMKEDDFRAVVRDKALWTQMSDASLSDWGRWEVERGHDDVLVSAMLAVVTYAQNPVPKMQGQSKLLDTGLGEEEQLQGVMPNMIDDVTTSLQRHYRKAMSATRKAEARRKWKDQQLRGTNRLVGV